MYTLYISFYIILEKVILQISHVLISHVLISHVLISRLVFIYLLDCPLTPGGINPYKHTIESGTAVQ